MGLYKHLDESKVLSAILSWFRTKLPARRGLMVLGAIGLAVISLVVHIVYVATANAWIGLCGFTILHIAVIVGFVGLLLAEALGRGFRE